MTELFVPIADVTSGDLPLGVALSLDGVQDIQDNTTHSISRVEVITVEDSNLTAGQEVRVFTRLEDKERIFDKISLTAGEGGTGYKLRR